MLGLTPAFSLINQCLYLRVVLFYFFTFNVPDQSKKIIYWIEKVRLFNSRKLKINKKLKKLFNFLLYEYRFNNQIFLKYKKIQLYCINFDVNFICLANCGVFVFQFVVLQEEAKKV